MTRLGFKDRIFELWLDASLEGTIVQNQVCRRLPYEVSDSPQVHARLEDLVIWKLRRFRLLSGFAMKKMMGQTWSLHSNSTFSSAIEPVSWRSEPGAFADPGRPFSLLGVAADPATDRLLPDGAAPVGVAAEPAGVDAPTPPLTLLIAPYVPVSKTPSTFSYTCSITLRIWMKSLAIRRSLQRKSKLETVQLLYVSTIILFDTFDS